MEKTIVLKELEMTKYFKLERPIYKAIFISEAKGRFRCEILINGKYESCYVPLTCKIEKLFHIKKGTPLLVFQTDKQISKYQFTLFAVILGRNKICINGNYTNKIVYSLYSQTHPDAHREVLIDNYKSDVWIPSEQKIIEAKTIISLEEKVVIPNYRSDRFLLQLEEINKLLQNGFKVDLCFILFSKTVKELIIDRKNSIGAAIVNCLENGMQIISYYAIWGYSKFTISIGPTISI